MSGGVFGVLFLGIALFVIPYDRTLVPVGMAGVIVLRQVELMLTSAHPYALFGPILAIIVVSLSSLYWMIVLQRRQRE
jgi:hypothetical protein